jgi:hypothetical protein
LIAFSWHYSQHDWAQAASPEDVAAEVTCLLHTIHILVYGYFIHHYELLYCAQRHDECFYVADMHVICAELVLSMFITSSAC